MHTLPVGCHQKTPDPVDLHESRGNKHADKEQLLFFLLSKHTLINVDLPVTLISCAHSIQKMLTDTM